MLNEFLMAGKVGGVILWFLAAVAYTWKGNQSVEGSPEYNEMQALARMAMICTNVWLAALFLSGPV